MKNNESEIRIVKKINTLMKQNNDISKINKIEKIKEEEKNLSDNED